ncbi:DUF1983 domain-containing protein [Acinetobacter baumannii]|nr:DUF1983 domain-containing protein [Acinetobacter baumannii]
MNGLKRAKILSYNAKGRTAQVHIHGLTDGASEGITATFAYPVGDSDLDTEIQIVDGEDVYVFFENGNEERPVIHSYVSHGDGAIVGVRRIRQDNIEFISKENLKVDSGTTVSIKTPLMNVQANTQQTGNSTLTGNSTVVGNTSVAGNSAVAGSMAVGTTLTVAGVPIDPKAIEGAFKDALNKLESLKEELKEQGEKIDETKDQVSQEIDEKIKEVEELIENIKDSDAFKLLEEGMKHFDEEVQKIHEQVKEVNQIAQNKVDEVRAYIDQEINNTKLIVDQHNNEANLRLDEANQRIDQSIQANEALVADAQQRAIRAEKELDDKIGFIKSETDSIIADVRSDSNEIRLVAENAKKIADQEVLDRKKQAADTLNVIDQTKAALKQDIDQNLVKAGQMIDDAKLALGEETNTLINQKIEPVVTQTEAAVKKVDQIAAQYIDLDKKVDSGFLAEAEARANDKEALTQSFELKFAEMQNEFGKSNALISEDIKTLAAQDKAFTEQISTAQSQIGDNKTAINKVERTVSDLNQSIAEKTSQIESTLKNSQEQIEGNAANIEKVESSVKLVDEKVVSEAKKLEDLKTDFNSNKTKTESDIATITQSVSDGDKALSLRIDQTKAALEEADRKSNANILEVTESLTELEQSTASKFSELDTSISKENLKVQGQITDVQKSVSTLESNTNTSINGLSSSLKTTDDLAKLAFDNAAEAQQTGTTAVKATEALSQNLLSLKSQTQVTSGVRAVVTTKGIDDWTRWRTTAEAKVIQDSDALGGYILELGNNADNDETWVHWNEFVKINPDTLYRVRARFRRVLGENGSIYLGVACKNADLTREAKSADNPTTSTHELRIVTTGSASPNFGGFHQQFFTRSNAIFIIKYLIKLPIGYKLYPAANLMGDGSVDKFIGSTDGTGRFEVYVRMVKSGATGRFDTSGFVHVAGGPAPTPESPLIWTLAQIECYDVTDYASADPNLQDFVSTANESLGTLTNFKETWASKLTEMSSKLDRTNSAYILNSDLTNTNIERAIAASSNQLKSEYIDPLQKNTESLKENILTNVDLSGLNPDIYYPVIFQLATGKQKYDFKVFCTLGGQNNSNVPWATHGTRSFGLNCEWSVTANGWGTQAENRIIDKFSFSWTAQSPLINIKQMPNSSIETVFLRGGARYDISHYKTITPLIKTESFTALGQSIEPIQYNSSLVPVPIFAEIVKAQDTAAAASRTVADIQRDYVTSSKLNEAVASSNERLSALYSANSQTIMASALQTFEKDWIIRTPSGSRIGMRLIEDQTCRGGYALRMGDNSGNDEIWLNWFSTLPIDDNKMYRIKYRYRRVSGAGVVYVGATCFNAAKSAFITDANYINGDIGSSHYVVGGAAPALGSWVTGVAYFKGRSAGASSGAGTLTNPKTFANKAAFFTPVFIGNYAAQAGEVDLDYIDIEDADNIAEFESFKTTYTTDVGAYAGSLQTLTSVYGPNAINLKSQVDLINGMKGKYVMGMDNNGVFSGLSMVSEQNNGTVQTSIGFQADRIFFTTGSSSTKYMPFIVQDNQVIMNSDVFIKNLTAANFKAKSLTAEVLNVDSLSSITGNFGTFISVAPDGSKQIISGGSTQIFYPNGNLAMRIGIK